MLAQAYGAVRGTKNSAPPSSSSSSSASVTGTSVTTAAHGVVPQPPPPPPGQDDYLLSMPQLAPSSRGSASSSSTGDTSSRVAAAAFTSPASRKGAKTRTTRSSPLAAAPVAAISMWKVSGDNQSTHGPGYLPVPMPSRRRSQRTTGDHSDDGDGDGDRITKSAFRGTSSTAPRHGHGSRKRPSSASVRFQLAPPSPSPSPSPFSTRRSSSRHSVSSGTGSSRSTTTATSSTAATVVRASSRGYGVHLHHGARLPTGLLHLWVYQARHLEFRRLFTTMYERHGLRLRVFVASRATHDVGDVLETRRNYSGSMAHPRWRRVGDGARDHVHGHFAVPLQRATLCVDTELVVEIVCGILVVAHAKVSLYELLRDGLDLDAEEGEEEEEAAEAVEGERGERSRRRRRRKGKRILPSVRFQPHWFPLAGDSSGLLEMALEFIPAPPPPPEEPPGPEPDAAASERVEIATTSQRKERSDKQQQMEEQGVAQTESRPEDEGDEWVEDQQEETKQQDREDVELEEEEEQKEDEQLGEEQEDDEEEGDHADADAESTALRISELVVADAEAALALERELELERERMYERHTRHEAQRRDRFALLADPTAESPVPMLMSSFASCSSSSTPRPTMSSSSSSRGHHRRRHSLTGPPMADMIDMDAYMAPFEYPEPADGDEDENVNEYDEDDGLSSVDTYVGNQSSIATSSWSSLSQYPTSSMASSVATTALPHSASQESLLNKQLWDLYRYGISDEAPPQQTTPPFGSASASSPLPPPSPPPPPPPPPPPSSTREEDGGSARGSGTYQDSPHSTHSSSRSHSDSMSSDSLSAAVTDMTRSMRTLSRSSAYSIALSEATSEASVVSLAPSSCASEVLAYNDRIQRMEAAILAARERRGEAPERGGRPSPIVTTQQQHQHQQRQRQRRGSGYGSGSAPSSSASSASSRSSMSSLSSHALTVGGSDADGTWSQAGMSMASPTGSPGVVLFDPMRIPVTHAAAQTDPALVAYRAKMLARRRSLPIHALSQQQHAATAATNAAGRAIAARREFSASTAHWMGQDVTMQRAKAPSTRSHMLNLGKPSRVNISNNNKSKMNKKDGGHGERAGEPARDEDALARKPAAAAAPPPLRRQRSSSMHSISDLLRDQFQIHNLTTTNQVGNNASQSTATPPPPPQQQQQQQQRKAAMTSRGGRDPSAGAGNRYSYSRRNSNSNSNSNSGSRDSESSVDSQVVTTMPLSSRVRRNSKGRSVVHINGVAVGLGKFINVGTVPGVIRYIGHTMFAPGVWIGIELVDRKGKHNGTVQRVPYFECQDGHGIFIRAERLDITVQ